jgi:hypothetical protein
MDGFFITIPVVLADKHPHVKTAITLPEIIRSTNAFSLKYRPGCTPKLLDSNPKALFLHYNVKCNKKDSDPAGHDVRIQFDVTKVQESQKAADLDVQVSCSCPAFLYWGAQWNLHQQDGLLGTPRPKLVAPTERLDLRANYVICKHVHSVFERILPSVQHNIVKILREREIQRHKDEERKTPERLRKKQDEMRRKYELEKIRKIKDKKVRDKLLKELEGGEQARLLHEQELTDQSKAPGKVDEDVVEREGPALEPEPEEFEVPEEAPEKEPATEPEEKEIDIEDLTKQEEKRRHEEGEPHIHTGLPYETEKEPEEEESASDMLGRLWKQIKEPGKKSPAYMEKLRNVWNKIKNWVTRKKSSLEPGEILSPEEDEDLSAIRDLVRRERGKLAKARTAIEHRDAKKGMRVRWLADMELKGTVEKVGKNYATVHWDGGHESTVTANILLGISPQRRLQFAAKLEDIGVGDSVWFDANPDARGKVLEILPDKKAPQTTFVKVDWGKLGIHEVPVHRLRLGQKSLFGGAR